jgi:uncharacterized delta-60 repeat protein
VTVNFNSGDDIAYASAVQSDGKLVLAGSATSSSTYGAGTEFGLVRLNLDGSLDSTFGSGGKLTTDLGTTGAGVSNDAARGMTILGDGRIVAAGYAQVSTNQQFALARYQPSNQVTITARPVPQHVVALPISDKEFELSWDQDFSGHVTGFRIQRLVGSNWTDLGIVSQATRHQDHNVFRDDGGGAGLSASTTYSYRVTAIIDGSPLESPPVSVTGTTDASYAGLVDAPRDVREYMISSSQISVTWAPYPVDDITGYDIQITQDGATWTHAVFADQYATAAYIDGLAENQRYGVRVVPLNGAAPVAAPGLPGASPLGGEVPYHLSVRDFWVSTDSIDRRGWYYVWIEPLSAGGRVGLDRPEHLDARCRWCYGYWHNPPPNWHPVPEQLVSAGRPNLGGVGGGCDPACVYRNAVEHPARFRDPARSSVYQQWRPPAT